jgi:hypothetical protein
MKTLDKIFIEFFTAALALSKGVSLVPEDSDPIGHLMGYGGRYSPVTIKIPAVGLCVNDLRI